MELVVRKDALAQLLARAADRVMVFRLSYKRVACFSSHVVDDTLGGRGCRPQKSSQAQQLPDLKFKSFVCATVDFTRDEGERVPCVHIASKTGRPDELVLHHDGNRTSKCFGV